MKVMTYNILSGRYFLNEEIIDPSLAARVIREAEADLVGLNEVHGSGGKFTEQTEEIALKAGYKYRYFAPAVFLENSEYGNGFLSRYPITDVSVIKIPDTTDRSEDTYYETRCILKATVDAGEKVDVLVTHFGLAGAERDEAVKKVLEIARQREKNFILMGDFNCEPSSVHIKQLRKILKDTSDNDEKLLTYPSDNANIKIDYIFTNKEAKTVRCGVIDSVVSDHKPYYAEIVF